VNIIIREAILSILVLAEDKNSLSWKETVS